MLPLIHLFLKSDSSKNWSKRFPVNTEHPRVSFSRKDQNGSEIFDAFNRSSNSLTSSYFSRETLLTTVLVRNVLKRTWNPDYPVDILWYHNCGIWRAHRHSNYRRSSAPGCHTRDTSSWHRRRRCVNTRRIFPIRPTDRLSARDSYEKRTRPGDTTCRLRTKYRQPMACSGYDTADGPTVAWCTTISYTLPGR